MGLSDPVTKDKFTKAKADIEKAGGTVLHEITLGMNGIVVSLPSDQAESFKSKSYVDFIEEDQAGKSLSWNSMYNAELKRN